MKKDGLILIGGLAVGAVAFFVFKDKILGSRKKASAAPAGADETIVVTQTAQTSTPSGTSQPTQSQPQTPAKLPYEGTEIRSDLLGTPAYQEMFGGCDFPIVPDSSSVCVKRIQDAFDVEQSGVFDLATQEALDGYIETIPNRNEGFWSGFTREGCISSDPATGTESNVCGLSHDQYLDVLFKMGIPLTETYD